MGTKLMVIVVMLVFLCLQLVSSTVIKAGTSTSTCCSKCPQSNPFMNTKFNPSRFQSFTIFGVKNNNPASWFSTVFKGFPIAYTWRFLEVFQDLEERINNGHASCGGTVDQFFYEDISDATLDTIYQSLINVLEYTSPEQNYSQNLGLTYAATLRGTRARRPTSIVPSLRRKYLMFVAASSMNSLKFNKQNFFANCLNQANEEYQESQTPYVPEEGDQLNDMILSWGWEDFFQSNRAPVDLATVKDTQIYYKFKDSDNLSKKCPKVPKINPAFKVRRRRLQQSIQELSTFNVYLERNKAGEASLLSPANVDLLINIPMTGDVVYSTDPNVVNNGFSQGETPFSLWANIAAQIFGPTIYCHVPSIKGLLETSCPATCNTSC